MKVSILSAVHNEEEHLPAMIESVKCQSHADWELLLVDDGSTDGTGGVIADAAAGDARVKGVRGGAKVGKVAAFNAAYRAASGDIVVLLAGDDLLPQDSLRIRVNAIQGSESEALVVARFKMRTLSADPKMDGIILPRGEKTSTSGGVIALSRKLADLVFPVPEDLISEDIWIGEAAMGVATTVVDVPQVVLLYRIHEGNSNPRHKGFEQMSAAMARRHLAWARLVDSPLPLSQDARDRLRRLAELERLRLRGRTWQIAMSRGPNVVEKMAFCSMSSSRLYSIRTRFYMFFSGRR